MFEENSDSENEEDFEKLFKNVAQYSDTEKMAKELKDLNRKKDLGKELTKEDLTRINFLKIYIDQNSVMNNI
jgi:hypothetical protein